MAPPVIDLVDDDDEERGPGKADEELLDDEEPADDRDEALGDYRYALWKNG